VEKADCAHTLTVIVWNADKFRWFREARIFLPFVAVPGLTAARIGK
jgi:hypothetical protein